MLENIASIGTDEWRTRWQSPITGFALLDASFAPDAVLVSDVADSTFDAGAACRVYCFSLTGERLWQHELPPETNVPWLAWHSGAGEWLGIRHHVEKREPDMLLRWSREGDLLSHKALGLVGEYAILPSGQLLVTGNGDVVGHEDRGSVGTPLCQKRLTPRTLAGAGVD